MSPGLNHYKANPARSPKQLKKKATNPKVHGLSITIMFPPLLAPPESCISLAFPFGKTPLSSLHLLLAYIQYGDTFFFLD
ncbi:hypothetical protein V8C43DRAFT_276165 [Trichoderma afarasin]